MISNNNRERAVQAHQRILATVRARVCGRRDTVKTILALTVLNRVHGSGGCGALRNRVGWSRRAQPSRERETEACADLARYADPFATPPDEVFKQTPNLLPVLDISTLVLHGLYFTRCRAGHWLGVHRRKFLGDQGECDSRELEQAFTPAGHRLNVLLVASR